MRLAEIRIYPVKGLKGVTVEAATVEPWGLEGDRRFMLTDPDGRFLTQREHPRMAIIAATSSASGLTLSVAGQEPIAVAFPSPDGPRTSVTVWRDTVSARDCGDQAGSWLSSALGAPVRLVHMPDPARARPVDPDFSDPGDVVTFADGFPLLVTNRASLDDLEGRLGRAVGMDLLSGESRRRGRRTLGRGWLAATSGRRRRVRRPQGLRAMRGDDRRSGDR